MAPSPPSPAAKPPWGTHCRHSRHSRTTAEARGVAPCSSPAAESPAAASPSRSAVVAFRATAMPSRPISTPRLPVSGRLPWPSPPAAPSSTPPAPPPTAVASRLRPTPTVGWPPRAILGRPRPATVRPVLGAREEDDWIDPLGPSFFFLFTETFFGPVQLPSSIAGHSAQHGPARRSAQNGRGPSAARADFFFPAKPFSFCLLDQMFKRQ